MRLGRKRLRKFRVRFRSNMFLARSHEEATYSSDCGDAGDRYRIPARAERHDRFGDDDSEEREARQGQGRDIRAEGHPGVAGEGSCRSGRDRFVEAAECREGCCVGCRAIDRSECPVAGCDRYFAGYRRAVAGAERCRSGTIASGCRQYPEEQRHRPTGHERQPGRDDQHHQDRSERCYQFAGRATLQRDHDYAGRFRGV